MKRRRGREERGSRLVSIDSINSVDSTDDGGGGKREGQGKLVSRLV